MKRVVIALALGGCSQILGLTEPKQEGDAGVIDDAPPDAPLPGTVKITTGATGMQGQITSVPAGISCPGTCEFTFPVGTEVTLSAQTTADTFTGFFQGGCTGGQTCTITPAGNVEVFARYWSQRNLWFVTSTVQKPGAFDNVEAADALCDTLAANAGLIERDYIAWLPTTTQGAFQRMQALSVGQMANGWLRPDGQVFVPSASALQQGKVLFPPRLDEFGRDVGDAAVAATDTLGDSTAANGTHCQDWASEGAPAVLAGEPAGGTSRWTSVSTTGCDQDSHLYCLSAIDNAGFASPPLSATVVFVTQGTVAGNAGFSGFDQLCSTEANNAGLPNPTTKALITGGGGKPVKQRFLGLTFTGEPVMRPDGTVIAPNMNALLDGAPFAAPPNVTANNQFVDAAVWIGGGGFADFQADCASWEQSGGFGATRPAATTRDATFFQQTPCSQSLRVLCVNAVVAQAKPTAGNRQPQATRGRP